jgi:phasin family protein
MNGMNMMSQFNDALTGGVAEAGRAYLAGFAKLNAEVVSFVGTRLHHDAEFGRKAAKCADLTELTTLQQAWAQQAAEAYMTEAGKMVELMTEITSGSLKPLNKQMAQSAGQASKVASAAE